MEELHDIEQLTKYLREHQYEFPVLYIGEQVATFNKAARPFVQFDQCEVFASSSYIVFLPASKKAVYTLGIRQNVQHVPTINIEGVRTRYSIKTGHYKLYKYKDGVAIKKYERLQDGDVQ